MEDEHIDRFLTEFVGKPGLPALDLPEDFGMQEVRAEPKPIFRIEPLRGPGNRMSAGIWFEYPGETFSSLSAAETAYDPETRELVRRNIALERQAREALPPLPLRPLPRYLQDEGMEWEITTKALPTVLWTLTKLGWRVESKGALYRQPAEPQFSVTTGIDWFDVEGSVDFGPVKTSLPELLKALKRGETMVQLDDGSLGADPGGMAGTLRASGSHCNGRWWHTSIPQEPGAPARRHARGPALRRC